MGKRGVDILAWAVVATFLLYFVTCCFKVLWGGDLRVYLAGIEALYADGLHHTHETLKLPASTSIAFTPYLYGVAAVGAALHLEAYRALQVAGVANLLLYVVGLLVFMRVYGGRQRAVVSAAVFLFITLLLRDHSYRLSSEISLWTLPVVPAYPSTNAWGVAMLAFAALEVGLSSSAGEGFGRRRAFLLFVVAFATAYVLASHALTGSWLFGILGLRALIAVVGRWSKGGGALDGAGFFLGAVVVGGVAACFWPDVAFLNESQTTAAENKAFKDAPFSPFVRLYALAFLALLVDGTRLARRAGLEGGRPWRWSQYGLWAAVGLLATFGAFLLLQYKEIDYRARYAYFMAFFPQVYLAVFSVRAVEKGATWWSSRRRGTRRVAFPASALGIAFLVILALWHSPTAQRKHVFLPEEFAAMPPAMETYLDDYIALRPWVHSDDVILVHGRKYAMKLAGVVGAKTVAVTWAFGVHDDQQRGADVKRFYAREQRPAVRQKVVEKWGVTRVLVTAGDAVLIPALKAQFGPPIFQDERHTLFKTAEKATPKRSKPRTKSKLGRRVPASPSPSPPSSSSSSSSPSPSSTSEVTEGASLLPPVRSPLRGTSSSVGLPSSGSP